MQSYYARQFSLFSEILSIPIKNDTLNLYALYERETTKLIERNKTYNGLLLIISFIFLGFISTSLYLLATTNKNLTQTMSDLEMQKSLYQALSEANQRVYNLASKQEIFDAITVIATTYMKVASCWIGQKIKHSDEIEIISFSGIGKEPVQNSVISIDDTKPEGKGAVGLAYRSAHSVIINDYEESELTRPWYKVAKNWGLNSLAAFPIMQQDRIEGIITFYSLNKHFFTPEIVQLIQELIDDIGIALERLALQEKQQQLLKEQTLSAIAFDSQEAIIITDSRGKIIKANNAFAQMSGYSENEVLNQTPRILKSNFHGADFYHDLWHNITSKGKWQGEVWNRKKDGTLFPVYQTITAVYGEDGLINNFVSHAIDITSSKEAEMEISYLRSHDNLTGLSNRNFLLQKIEQLLTQDQSNHAIFDMVLVIVNINRFKTYNETLGHLAGDAILIETANRLKSIQFKNTTNVTPSRIGADEFSVLCQLEKNEQIHEQQVAQQIIHNITETLAELYVIEEENLKIDCTLGVTLFTNASDETAEEIIQQANTALHRAKLNPKLNLEFFQAEMQQQAILLRNMELALTNALENEEFVLHYQPQINLDTGAVIGAEALIRWQKPDGELMSPGQFIPILESSDLIIPVGQWLLKRALNELRAVQYQLKQPILLAINLSAIQFRDPNLISVIQETLEETGRQPQLLELEVTESVLMDDPKDVTAILGACRTYHV